MTVQASFATVARADGRCALVTVVRGRRAGARLLVHADGGLEGTLGDLELDARAVAAVEVVISWPAPALERLGAIDRATYIAVLSNDPKIDDEILRLALDADPAYIGAMGSMHAQLERRERLLAAGVGERELARITAPVGLDLGALSAEETALSIMAEIVAVHHRRGGRRLSARVRGAAPKVPPTPLTLDTIQTSEYRRAAAADTAPFLAAVPSRSADAGTEVDSMTRRAEVRPHDRDRVLCSR